MNELRLGRVVFTLLVMLVSAPPLRAQGPLAPPGAPAPAMKTLDQVEPRIPITNIPAIITTPGSYYLTGNFNGAAGVTGITIAVSAVSLDLQGYTLAGVPGSGDGITTTGSRRGIVIRNGIIHNWGGDGVDAGLAVDMQIMDIVAFSNGVDGIRLNSHSAVLRCVANSNNGNGISGSGQGCLIKDCVASLNLFDGIKMPTSSHVSDCTARDNFGDGFEMQGGSVLQNCSSVANDKAGIRVVTGPGTVVQNCAVAASGTEGISIGTYDTYVLNNTCDQSGQVGVSAGILVTTVVNQVSHGNRIDSNHLTGNDIGILVLAPSNLIVRNSVSWSMSGINYSNVANNSVGNITNVAGLGQFTVSNPWASSLPEFGRTPPSTFPTSSPTARTSAGSISRATPTTARWSASSSAPAMSTRPMPAGSRWARVPPTVSSIRTPRPMTMD